MIIIYIYRMQNILCVLNFANDIEDWFVYGKFNVFVVVYKCLMFKF